MYIKYMMLELYNYAYGVVAENRALLAIIYVSYNCF